MLNYLAIVDLNKVGNHKDNILNNIKFCMQQIY